MNECRCTNVMYTIGCENLCIFRPIPCDAYALSCERELNIQSCIQLASVYFMYLKIVSVNTVNSAKQTFFPSLFPHVMLNFDIIHFDIY